MEPIILKKVKVHNLRSVDLVIQPGQLIVCTGVSGSGKSSLAFDTIYVEGQRRYVESLSAFARRYMGELAKPQMEEASNLSPTISIEQKTAGRNPRSTVGTMTEIYDFLRVLFARVSLPHCPVSGEPVRPQSKERIIAEVQALSEGAKVSVLAPFAKSKKGEFAGELQDLLRKGFMRARIDGQMVDLTEEILLDKNALHDIDVVIDRLVPISHTISSEGAQDGASDLFSPGRKHCPSDKESPGEGEDDATDCQIRLRECGKWGLEIKKAGNRIAEAVSSALEMGKGVCIIQSEREEKLYSMHAFCPKSGLSYEALQPQDFSFNTPHGMCPRCMGLGTVEEFELEKIIDPTKSLSEDVCLVAPSYHTVRYKNIYDNLARLYKFSVKTPWKDLSEKAKEVFLFGNEKKWTPMYFLHPQSGKTWTEYVSWKGALHEARSRLMEAKSDLYKEKMQKLMQKIICPVCQGARLKPYPAAALLGGKKIHEITALTVTKALHFFETLSLTQEERFIAEELLKEIEERLHFLKEVGLHYLALDRTSPTLSGGEAQRVRLASQIGSGLVGVIYILDEPSIGLHPRDNARLIASLKGLRDKGNTVIVVEHDEETILSADEVIDFGPLSGNKGGQILFQGGVKEFLECKQSLTAGYLSGRLAIPIPKKRRKPTKEKLKIIGAEHHNLKKIDVTFPLGLFIAVTGVSGSGKSSLIQDILFPALNNQFHNAQLEVGKHEKIVGLEHLDKVISIDQSPIGRLPRSNPATYIKVFDDIRDLFASLPESLARGYKSGRFSFNVKEGSCSKCEGMGMLKIDMDFLEDAFVVCDACGGLRFDEETLSVLYKGKTIADVLQMTVQEARDFFASIPSIAKKLEMLIQVGMDYIQIGQPSPTLSGGEAQRVKLAKELLRPSTGKTLYLLDEPTTGLHFHDCAHLLKVLHALVDKGNTVIVIEHNRDVIKSADWIIDLGPEGGEEGGRLVAEGSFEKIAKMETATGRALRSVFGVESGRGTGTGTDSITVVGAEEHNLKRVNVQIPRGKITVVTGPSGSGKSSLAFDTIYAEGQRRYTESLSPYARQFVQQMPKPKVGYIEGLSPAIAIEQKAHAGNPRSTVGTLTEIYDYLRLLWARAGIAYNPRTGERIQAISKEKVADEILGPEENSPIYTEMNSKFGNLAQPAPRIWNSEAAPKQLNLNKLSDAGGSKGGDVRQSQKPNSEFTSVYILAPLKAPNFEEFKRKGFLRVRLNGEFYELENEIPFEKTRKNKLELVIDRLKVNKGARKRVLEAIGIAAEISKGEVIVLKGEEEHYFNLAFADKTTGESFPEIGPHSFAFNTQAGMCPDCFGLGVQYGANLSQFEAFMQLTVQGLLTLLWKRSPPKELARLFPLQQKLSDLQPKQLHFLLSGQEEDEWKLHSCGIRYRWSGLNEAFAKAGHRGNRWVKEALAPWLDEIVCPSCKGTRLNPLASCVKVDGHTLHEVCSMPIEKSLSFIENLQVEPLLEEVQAQLKNRLHFLVDVGLQYLSLSRKAPTLSNGEAQRIRLARQLGSGLTGVLYVLDEPTIGLHPKEIAQLSASLKKLKELGNTLLIVEHDPLTLALADQIIEMGPKAGKQGGQVIATGTLEEIKQNQDSLTGAYLTGRKEIPFPKKRRRAEHFFPIRHANKHNLKDLSFDLPLGLLTCITGVSGSGKSTLLHETILPAAKKENAYFDKVISIDQNPIGHTVRSDVVTYVDALTPLREFFAQLPQSKSQGLQPKHFSYNHRAGMCTGCFGLGYKKIEMYFLPSLAITCPDCKGLRLGPKSLHVRYKEKTLGEILQLTVDEALPLFDFHPKIKRILSTVSSVGLGYLALGQEIATLSGGEAQRLKISSELAKRSSGHTLYLLDEPTTGLHQEDIALLITVLQKLVDKGNTMVVIEHQTDFIRCADFLIELGPKAGDEGGFIIFQGTV